MLTQSVTSGEQTMAFLWRGDMLYTKRGVIPPESRNEWTCFFLNLREPMDVPKAAEFGKFLATSMAFTSSIREVDVFMDDDRIHHFHKKVSEPRPLTFSSGEYIMSSPNSLFKLSTVAIKNIQVIFTIDSYDPARRYHERRKIKTLWTDKGCGDRMYRLHAYSRWKVNSDFATESRKGNGTDNKKEATIDDRYSNHFFKFR